MIKLGTLILFCFLAFSCSEESESKQKDDTSDDEWSTIKRNTKPINELPNEFAEPEQLSISTLGWEDGLSVSRDGLYLYATYMPADLLSYTINDGVFPENIQLYDRGPHYDIDFNATDIGVTDYPWYHSDIIFSSRNSTSSDFKDWSTSDMKRAIYSEGAFSVIFSDEGIDIGIFTSNENYTELNNFKVIQNTAFNPSGLGTFISTTAELNETDKVNTTYTEDNPHIERLDSTNLVLFFDSEDRPGGQGGHDIWFSTSSDNGTNWSEPSNLTSINTDSKEHQPHLYDDGDKWWLYFSAYYSDGKLAIYRSYRENDDWSDWSEPELVLSAGDSAGVGEPTLTEFGELYFVLVYENPNGSYYDQYDADPWKASPTH